MFLRKSPLCGSGRFQFASIVIVIAIALMGPLNCVDAQLTVQSKQPPLNLENQQATVENLQQSSPTPPSEDQQPKNLLSQFDQDSAFTYLKEVCAIGPRMSASRGMRRQQGYIEKHFQGLGAKLFNQPFSVRSPFTNRHVRLHNLIVQFHPQRERRLMICCHYDTRPFPDLDRTNPKGKFIGANDGASGVALLCELGKHMQDLDGVFGVDFVFFDGEEFVVQRQRDPMFLGSTHFANQYAAGKIKWKYEFAVLVDMVADKDLQIYYEGNSLGYADGLTRSIWTVAQELGVKEFIPQQRHKIRDDHLPLNAIAKIRTCDIIDFDYPNPDRPNEFWHTTQDTVENCSADSLGKVGSVVLEWLRQMQKLNTKKGQ